MEQEDATQLQLGSVFDECPTLFMSEVAFILQGRKEAGNDERNTFDAFVKALDYCQRFDRYKNKAAVKEVRTVLTKHVLKPFEMAALANLCPETAEEARALVPTLDRVDDEELAMLLMDLRSFTTGEAA